MKRKYNRLATTLLILAVILSVLTPVALAAGESLVKIPITVSLRGEIPKVDEDYEIVLKADSPAYPMPKGSVNETYKMVITGAKTAELPEIKFSSVGVYTYTISQTPGANELGVYDDSLQSIIVYITNAENGSGLEATVIAYGADETEKLDQIVFHNDYLVEIPDEEPPGGEVEIPDEEPPGGEVKPPSVPKTGDVPIWPYIAAFLGAGILLFALIATRKKKKV